jgi:tetratricopeptide (TPR) repeat protein
LGHLGNSYVSLGEYEKALEHFQNAVDILRQVGEKTELALRLGIMGNLYSQLGRSTKSREQASKYFGQALNHYIETLELARETEDKSSEAYLLRSIGNAYGNLGQYDQAIDQFRMASLIFATLGLTDDYDETQHSIDLAVSYRDKAQG